MKKIFVILLAVGLFIMFIGGRAIASPDGYFNWGSELNPGQCPDGKLVINVTHKATNDLDSGEAGNWWAYDNYNKHIQVWQVDENTFCALVQYNGSFETVESRSPGNTDDIAAGINGTMQGGYKATITGTLKTEPLYSTRGNIGKFNYGCDAQTDPGDRSTCTLFNWVDTYFEAGWTFTYNWWGWIYRTGKNGTWINSGDGNSGDITD